MLPEQKKKYLSAKTMVKMESNENNQGMLSTTKILNPLKVSGFPNHCLELKIGAPIWFCII